MSKLTRFLGEYFFGSEIRKEYRRNEAVFREYCRDGREIRRLLRESKFEKICYTLAGNIIPNVLTPFSLGYYISTGSVPGVVLLATSEVSRAVVYLIAKKAERIKRENRDEFIRKYNKLVLVENQ